MLEQSVFGLEFTSVVNVGPGSCALAPKTLAYQGSQRMAMITEKLSLRVAENDR